QRAAHLAPAEPGPIVDRNLLDAQPVARGLELHLDGPAERPVAHLETPQGGSGDRPEGAEVGGARSDEDVHEADAEPRSEHRVPWMGAGGAPPQGARAD